MGVRVNNANESLNETREMDTVAAIGQLANEITEVIPDIGTHQEQVQKGTLKSVLLRAAEIQRRALEAHPQDNATICLLKDLIEAQQRAIGRLPP